MNQSEYHTLLNKLNKIIQLLERMQPPKQTLYDDPPSVMTPVSSNPETWAPDVNYSTTAAERNS